MQIICSWCICLTLLLLPFKVMSSVLGSVACSSTATFTPAYSTNQSSSVPTSAMNDATIVVLECPIPFETDVVYNARNAAEQCYQRCAEGIVILPGMDPLNQSFLYAIHESILPPMSENVGNNCWLHAAVNHLFFQCPHEMDLLLESIPNGTSKAEKQVLSQIPLLVSIKKMWSQHKDPERIKFPDFKAIMEAMKLSQSQIKRVTGRRVDTSLESGKDAAEGWVLFTDVIHREVYILRVYRGQDPCDSQNPCVACQTKIFTEQNYICSACKETLTPQATIVSQEKLSKKVNRSCSVAARSASQMVKQAPEFKEERKNEWNIYGCNIPVAVAVNSFLLQPLDPAYNFAKSCPFLSVYVNLSNDLSIQLQVPLLELISFHISLQLCFCF